MIDSDATQGDLMRPFLTRFLQFLLCNLRHKCPTEIERTWKDSPTQKDSNFACPFTTNKLFEKIQILNE